MTDNREREQVRESIRATYRKRRETTATLNRGTHPLDAYRYALERHPRLRTVIRTAGFFGTFAMLAVEPAEDAPLALLAIAYAVPVLLAVLAGLSFEVHD